MTRSWLSLLMLGCVIACDDKSIEPLDDTPVPTPEDDTECAGDAACSDGLTCNGVERCASGQCTAGTATECPHQTVCHESESAPSCHYDAPSPWLLYTGDDLKPLEEETPEAYNDAELRLFGVPAHLMGTASPIDLSQGAVRGKDFGIDQVRWAPDGSFAVFAIAEDLNWFVETTPMRVHWLRFGRGVPERPQLVEELPAASKVQLLDLNASALLTATSNRLYVSRFEGDGSSTAPVLEFPEVDFLSEAMFCGDGQHALVRISRADDSDDAQIVDLEGVAAPRALGAALPVSPDRTSVFEVRDGQVQLSSCSARTESASIPLTVAGGAVPAVHWSSDSRFVAYLERSEAETRLVMASRDGQVLWDKPGLDENFGWSPGVASMVFVAEGEVTGWGVVQAEEGRAVESLLSFEAPLDPSFPTWVGDRHFLFDATLGEAQAMWLAELSPDFAPRQVATQADGFWTALLDEAESTLFYVKRGAGGDELLALDLRDEGAEPRQLWDAPGATSLGLQGFSPDARHVLVTKRIVTDRETSELWRVPLAPANGDAVKLNSGRRFSLVSGQVFQPSSTAQRYARAR